MFAAVLRFGTRPAPLTCRNITRKTNVTHLNALCRTCLFIVDLLAPLPALLRPGEVGDGDDEEGVAWVGNTGKCIVPVGKAVVSMSFVCAVP